MNVIEHRLCPCGHGENEHFRDDSGEPGDRSWCEGCVYDRPEDKWHRFKTEAGESLANRLRNRSERVVAHARMHFRELWVCDESVETATAADLREAAAAIEKADTDWWNLHREWENAEAYGKEGWGWLAEALAALGVKDVFEMRERYHAGDGSESPQPLCNCLPCREARSGAVNAEDRKSSPFGQGEGDSHR